MMFYIDKSTNKVKMYSIEEINVDQKLFKVIEYEPTIEEQGKIEQNYEMWWVEDRLVFQESAIAKTKRISKENKDKIKDIKNKLADSNITQEEMAQEISKLCEIIKI